MGNMSNPIINRLGKTQFWYKYWFSKLTYASTLHQFKFLEFFIILFLTYGTTPNYNPFFRSYWINNQQKNTWNFFQSYPLYFRNFFYTNRILSIEHTFSLRIPTNEYFPMRIWLFKFQGWVILSVKWFKPWKMKTLPTRYFELPAITALNIFFNKKKTYLNRLKYILLFFVKKQFFLTKTYNF